MYITFPFSVLTRCNVAEGLFSKDIKSEKDIRTIIVTIIAKNSNTYGISSNVLILFVLLFILSPFIKKASNFTEAL